MSFFKKPNRKFRQRETNPDSDEEQTSEKKESLAGSVPKSSTSLETKKPAITTVSKEKDDKTEKARALLSFHEDEDGEETEVFKLKKSNYSRRLAKQREREKRKREQVTEKISISSIPQSKPGLSEKSDFTKKSEKKEPWGILSGRDAEAVDMESEDEAANPFKNVLQSGIIPDAATIYAMKKHRQMAREMGDYIPLEEEKEEDDKGEDLHNDQSDEEEPSRINFTIDTEAVERQKLRETFLSIQENNGNMLEVEDAAELDRWEEEQIKKGVSITQVSVESNQMPEPVAYSYQQQIANTLPYSSMTAPKPKPTVSRDIINIKETTLTTSDIKSRVAERLTTLRNTHKASQEELESCRKEIIDITDSMDKLKVDAPLYAKNYLLYQQMTGYVTDLVECMDLKVAHINLLEKKLINLYKSRAQRLFNRRQLDIKDQSDEYSSIANQVLKGVSVEYVNELRNSTMDELKLRRTAEREGRRMRRRKKRDRQFPIQRHQDGMSSDDEEPDSELLRFKEARANILKEAETIFEDVVEDFGTLDGVMINFERWKANQPTTYNEAYVPLCLPKIFGCFVKLALLDWNPLQEDRDFEKTSWYVQLIYYGCDLQPENDNEDPDINLLPGIMEKVILPKITTFIQEVWSPLSTKETTRLVKFLRTLIENYPLISGNSKPLQTCLKAIASRINKSLDDDVFIPVYPKELLENRSIGVIDFFNRQFWAAVKLFKNIVSWEGLIADQPLQQMALGALLNRYIVLGLHTSFASKELSEKCKTVVSIIPKTWFGQLKEQNALPLLKQFTNFLMKFADTFHSQCLKKRLSDDEAKDVLKDILQVLLVMELRDDASYFAKKYSISFKSS